jgi:hypothetical protein
LGRDSIWWDEGFSMWMADMPIPDMIWQTAHDAHPPLSYALLHEWIALAGREEFTLRLPSVFFGLLTVAVAYRIGQMASGRQAGLAGALLAAVMRLPVWWSQEIRMYAPAMFFTALGLLAALKLITGERRRWMWAAVLALALGAALTLYLFAGAVLALDLAFVVAFVVAERRWRLAAVWIASQIGALALFVPWVAYALPYLPSWQTPQQPVGFWFVVKLYLSTVFLGIATDIERYLPLLIGALVVLVGMGIVLVARLDRRRLVVWAALVIGVILPPVLVYLLSLPRGALNYPTPSPRYFVLLSTPVYVLIGWGAASLLSVGGRALIKWAGGLALAALIAIAGWSLIDYYSGLWLADDYQSLAATLQALRHPHDVVILNNDTDWPIFDYHYPEEYSHHIPKDQRIGDWKYADDLLTFYRENYDGVWLVQTRYAPVTDPNNELGRWLQERSWGQQRYVFPDGQLWFFSMVAERANPPYMPQVERWPDIFRRVEPIPFMDGARLVGFTQPVPEVRAGDLMIVGLGWEVDPVVFGEWPVAVQLLGPNGSEIASQLVTLNGMGLPEGERRFLPVEVFIPPSAAGGPAQVYFVSGQQSWLLGTVTVRARDDQPLEQAEIPASAVEVNARFGDYLTLVAVDLPEQTVWQPGESIPLVLYWRAERPIPERYKVFVHVIGEAFDVSDMTNIWGQQDQEPEGGARPTTSWRPGEVLSDDYLVPLQTDVPPGRYTIHIGLYLPLDGQRLPVSGADGAPLGDRQPSWKSRLGPDVMAPHPSRCAEFWAGARATIP